MTREPLRLISCDTHIAETPDLFTSRFPAALRDQAPHVREHDGRQYWVVGGHDAVVVGAPARAGDRFLPEEDYWERTHWEHVPESAYEPNAWLSALEAEGIYGSVVLPSVGLTMFCILETEVMDAACRAYNEWSLDFARVAPDRIRPIGMMNLDDIPAACREIERLKSEGLAGVMIPTRPPSARPYSGEEYEPLWSLLEDIDMPVILHVATDRNLEGGYSAARFGGIERMVNDADHVVRLAIMSMIFSGVFHRHPKLQIMSVENEGAWAVHFLQAMDWHWKNNLRFRLSGQKLESLDLLPSEYFRQNVWISITEDRAAVENREFIGVNNLVWGGDFPHAESTYPYSLESLDRLFAGVSDHERHLVTAATGAEFFGIDL